VTATSLLFFSCLDSGCVPRITDSPAYVCYSKFMRLALRSSSVSLHFNQCFAHQTLPLPPYHLRVSLYYHTYSISSHLISNHFTSPRLIFFLPSRLPFYLLLQSPRVRLELSHALHNNIFLEPKQIHRPTLLLKFESHKDEAKLNMLQQVHIPDIPFEVLL
jgi:hypothetical protein